MPSNFFNACGAATAADLAEIDSTLKFLRSAFKSSSKTGQLIQAFGGEPEMRELFVEFHTNRLGDLGILHRALFVQVWSAFEAFIRKLLIAYLNAFAEKKPDYESLEKYGLAKKNLENTGKALVHIRENRPRLTLDFFALAANAATSTPGSARVILNSSTFPLFMSGPSSDGVVDALDRVGIKLKWDDLGRIPEVQKALKTKGTRETAKQVELFLKEAARRRHNIVHRSEPNEAIADSDVAEAISVFGALAKGLLELARTDCDRKCA